MPEFLGALSDDERAAFQAAGRLRQVAKGEAIFHEGDDAGGVVAVIDGTVKVSLIGTGGREVLLKFSGPGELVGELAAVSDRPRTADVTAVNEVEALFVRAADFRRLALEYPRIGELVFENVAALLAEADRQRIDFATRDVTARIAGRLVELAQTTGEPEDRGVRITLPLSQDELAAWSGASREAVARSLHLLRGLGWIETGRREIWVLDIDALRGLVG
ncbi:MAG TPA: Crp/Fnr family transcriptional regulator [Solirubrobacteraceae bacterium]|nr:Crp/Fnr family transcriptional regulator [Solirubrobacteraceae bacterium]